MRKIMKKTLSAAMTTVMIMSMAACGNASDDASAVRESNTTTSAVGSSTYIGT